MSRAESLDGLRLADDFAAMTLETRARAPSFATAGSPAVSPCAQMSLAQMQTQHDAFAKIAGAYQSRVELLNGDPAALSAESRRRLQAVRIGTAGDLRLLWDQVMRIATATSVAKLAQDYLDGDPQRPIGLMKILFDSERRGFQTRAHCQPLSE